MDRDAEFQQLRPLLFSLAYRMLGTRADAEDIVQEAWLRWRSANNENGKQGGKDGDAHGEPVRSAKSYLTTVVARLSLDALKVAHRKRESYTGPWLPEPFIDPPGTQHIEMAELLSIAFLHLLESLSPAERVAFLLREAFDAGYDEIAAALETSEANSRQLVARSRKHIADRRPRFPVDRARHQQMLEQFLAACATGDPSQLTHLLSEDVIFYSDGGGKIAAALNPIYGPARVAKLLASLARKGYASSSLRFADVNGEPGVVLIDPRGVTNIITIQTDATDRLCRIFLIANPDKTSAAMPTP
jgi:RNA polymerase sigma-70 factor (ECF subfamily)